MHNLQFKFQNWPRILFYENPDISITNVSKYVRILNFQNHNK